MVDSGKATRDLRVLLDVGAARTLSDGQLLGRFVDRREGAVFEAIVLRHGPTVWGVCRRVLRDHHDAEDAFQATFLVLARRAASIAQGEKLGNWIYGVAHQTARKARAMRARRRAREGQVPGLPEPEAVGVQPDDRRGELDRELSRLPERYRIPFILCELEGRTHSEAAEQLGCPTGTVSSRLSRARGMLTRRLSRRAGSPSGGSLAVLLAQEATSACMPHHLVGSTARAASLTAKGGMATAGVVSAGVVSLMQGVLKTMMFDKFRSIVAVVLVSGVMATGAIALVAPTSAQDDGTTPAGKHVGPAARQEKALNKESVTAWGEEVGGLQAGLGFLPGEDRAYRHGEAVTLVVRLRNVGKEAVKFGYIKQFLDENPPRVTDADGRTVPQAGNTMLGFHGPTDVTLLPGKGIVLESRMHGASGVPYGLVQMGDEGKLSPGTYPLHVGTGKVTLQYGRVLGNTSAGWIEVDPTLVKLSTGKLELNIEPDPIAATHSRSSTVKVPTEGKPRPPLSSRDLSGTWRGERDGAKVEVEFKGGGKATWEVSTRRDEVLSALVRADMVLLDDRDSGSILLRFDLLRPLLSGKSSLVMGRLVRGKDGTVELTMGPDALEQSEHYYQLVKGLPLLPIPEVDGGREGEDGSLIWGEIEDGLQAGIGLFEVGDGTNRLGAPIRLVVKVRNRGSIPVTIAYQSEPFDDIPPVVKSVEGVRFPVRMPPFAFYKRSTVEHELQPGGCWDLGDAAGYSGNPRIEFVRPVVSERGEASLVNPTVAFEPIRGDATSGAEGRYRVSYPALLRSHPQLSTGWLDLRVR